MKAFKDITLDPVLDPEFYPFRELKLDNDYTEEPLAGRREIDSFLINLRAVIDYNPDAISLIESDIRGSKNKAQRRRYLGALSVEDGIVTLGTDERRNSRAVDYRLEQAFVGIDLNDGVNKPERFNFNINRVNPLSAKHNQEDLIDGIYLPPTISEGFLLQYGDPNNFLDDLGVESEDPLVDEAIRCLFGEERFDKMKEKQAKGPFTAKATSFTFSRVADFLSELSLAEPKDQGV